MTDYDRNVEVPELRLAYRLTGFCPVQGWGIVERYPFYFRARWEEWSFSASEDPNVDPVDIQMEAQGAAHGFFREEAYGAGPYDAGWMPLDEAETLIQRCTSEYLATKA